ncbi:hypothetical protein Y032_0007g3347 [Ancylostoma ceylanicum]|uniref:Uncharacterized protein n=1 Tax=Ancylostoma ceylanicum TaxID=53326 RepID=A0A016VPJ4_9BILA|nr:hypothetical protein Y032_0007g3347 [Ancylostoma ceylanicum]
MFYVGSKMSSRLCFARPFVRFPGASTSRPTLQPVPLLASRARHDGRPACHDDLSPEYGKREWDSKPVPGRDLLF